MLKFLWLLPIVTIAIPKITHAQRPSFAGIRPPGGLTQKDKYAQTKNTALENFNGVSGPKDTTQKKIINLPYGAPQRPPMGVPLVHPSAPEELLASYRQPRQQRCWISSSNCPRLQPTSHRCPR